MVRFTKLEMKDLFPGYYRKTDSEIRRIWENGLILFDANVLLNLYRYSDSTRETLLELIGKFSKQIFLPYQSALEYNRNRYEVIAAQEKAYNEFLNKIFQIQKDLQSTSQPPFLSANIDRDLNDVFQKVRSEVEDSIKKYSQYLQNDPIYEKLSNLFKDKITSPFDEKMLSDIYKEGEKRYEMKTPPGFEDEKTKDGTRKYGDLIVWKQVIQVAIEKKKDIILVTDERKIDWWWIIKDGRNMGPRQELVEEIKKEANVEFYMYSSERFLSYGQTFLKEQISQKALDEINAMKKSELLEIQLLKRYQQRAKEDEMRIAGKLLLSENRIQEINEELINLRKHKESLFKDSPDEETIQEYIHSINYRESTLEEEKSELLQELKNLRHIKMEIGIETLKREQRMALFEKNLNGDK